MDEGAVEGLSGGKVVGLADASDCPADVVSLLFSGSGEPRPTYETEEKDQREGDYLPALTPHEITSK